jgi:hypothetical protein
MNLERGGLIERNSTVMGCTKHTGGVLNIEGAG